MTTARPPLTVSDPSILEQLTAVAERAASGRSGASRQATTLRLVEHTADVPANWQPGDRVVVMADAPTANQVVDWLARGALDVLDGNEPLPALSRAVVRTARWVARGDAKPGLADLSTKSPTMRKVLRDARRVARADAPLLITGPTGAGKEHLAHAIHVSSTRAKGPFVAVNCGALPENLLESQLFGHERGAFTGADRRHRGFFEASDGGTLLLDEIGDMPLHLQVKLLSVLESHEVTPVGSTSPLSVDVRVLAATNRDLEADVDEGRFRSDLLFRLDVVRLDMPALHRRREDIPALAGRFLHDYAHKHDVEVAGVEPDAVAALMAYDWPGNVRELHNALERAMLMAQDGPIAAQHLPEAMRQQPTTPAGLPRETGETPAHGAPAGIAWPDVDEAIGRGDSLRQFRDEACRVAEAAMLERLLTRCHGRIDKTSERAGLRPRSLYDKMRNLGLRKEDFRAT